MGEVIYLFVSAVRNLLIGNIWAKLGTIALIAALAGLMVYDNRKRRRERQTFPYHSLTLMSETNTLHLMERGATRPKNVMADLNNYDTAAQVYEYVYKKFDEAAFGHLIIHRAGTEKTTEFVRDAEQSDAENEERLRVLMFQ